MRAIPYVCVTLSTKRRDKVSKKNRERLWIGQEGKCHWCKRYCLKKGNGGIPSEFTLDHIVPLSHGGTNHWRNMVGSCHKCNNKRNRVWEKLERIEL